MWVDEIIGKVNAWVVKAREDLTAAREIGDAGVEAWAISASERELQRRVADNKLAMDWVQRLGFRDMSRMVR
jgi:hypothetical protein